MTLWDAMEASGRSPASRRAAINAIKQFTEQVRPWRSLAMGGYSDELLAEQRKVSSSAGGRCRPPQRPGGAAAEGQGGGRTRRRTLANVNELTAPPRSLISQRRGQPRRISGERQPRQRRRPHEKAPAGAVTLMTLHAAKGLEFPSSDDRPRRRHPPAQPPRGNLNELEEERRLAFVGITRSAGASDPIEGPDRRFAARRAHGTSPFLSEMPQEMLEITDRTGLPA